MTDHRDTASALTQVRFAGALYLLIIVFGVSSEIFVRSVLIVKGDATATAVNILASPLLFRAGFAADTIMLLCDVAIAVVFYQLFKPVGKTPALMAAVFRLIQAAILGFNLLNYYSPILLLSNGIYMDSFEPAQLHALTLYFLDLHGHGYDLGLLFFGVSNLLLGYLVVRSNWFPAVLGYGLQAAAVVYLAGSLTRFLSPDFGPFIQPAYIVPLITELSFCLWLLIKGVRIQP